MAALLAQTDQRWELVVAYAWESSEARAAAESARSAVREAGVAAGNSGAALTRLRFVPVVGRCAFS